MAVSMCFYIANAAGGGVMNFRDNRSDNVSIIILRDTIVRRTCDGKCLVRPERKWQLNVVTTDYFVYIYIYYIGGSLQFS